MKKGFIPEQCILWKKQNIDESDMSMSNFDVLETLINTSHLWRYVLKCKECGQLYFFEFKEDVNWSGEGNGNDFQYSTWIPISPDGTEALIGKSPLELLDPALIPRIQSDLTPYRQDDAHWVGREKVEFVEVDSSLQIEQKISAKEHGLVKCDVCGEYKGNVKEKFLNRATPLEGDEGEEIIGVSCICDGIPCSKCKKNKIRRPISNSYDEEDNSISHTPYFAGMIPCHECKDKELHKSN